MLINRGLLFILLSGVCGISGAQEADSLVIDLKEIIIKENRIQLPLSGKPSSITVLDSRSFDNVPGLDFTDLLHTVAGVDIRSRGVNGIQNDVSIRGSSFDQVLLLINGIKVSDPQTGHHTFNLPVDLNAIDHIEIYKGPAARVFGQNAFAGAINIITRIPSDNVSVNALAGDFGLFGGNVSTSFGNIDFRNLISISHNRSTGYKYNTDYNLTNLFYQSEIFTDAGPVSIIVGISDRDFGANGFYASPDYKDQYESVRTAITAISFVPEIKNKNVTVTNRIYWRQNRDEYLFIRSDPDFYRNIHTTNVTGVDINFLITTRLGVTGAGVDFSNPGIRSNRLGNRSRFVSTLFLDHRFVLTDNKLSITPGLQVNLFSDFKNSILPGVDIGFDLSPGIMLFANSGYTYRVPTYTDLHYEDPVNTSNPDLQPEYAFSNEVGIKSKRLNGVTFQANYFHRRSTNMIDRTKEHINDKWRPENINTIIFDGLDISTHLDFTGLTTVLNSVITSIDLSYCFINSEVIDELPEYSKFEFENLRNQAAATINLQYLKGLNHSISYRNYDRVNMNDYSLIDSRISWRNKNLKIFMDITNILNTMYRETNFVIMPGRWVKLGICFIWEM
ncbi:MAG: TonB-dependent receptor [Bacteroidales bacterium]|nr:TonB-dependent receptor [Bacteroidales bacterium]